MSYSPSLARWMQADPAGYVNGLNPDQFVTDNPTNATDPTGLKKHIYVFEGLGGYSERAQKAVQTGNWVEKSMMGIISFPYALAFVQNAMMGLRNDDVEWEYHAQDENVARIAANAAKVAAVDHTAPMRETSEAALKAGGIPAEYANQLCKRIPGHDQIIVVGFSQGGDTAIDFANELGKKGITVDLGITIDPIPKGINWWPNYKKPANATTWLNYFQKFDGSLLIEGHPMAGADNKKQDYTVDAKAEVGKKWNPDWFLPPLVGGHLYITSIADIQEQVHEAFQNLNVLK